MGNKPNQIVLDGVKGYREKEQDLVIGSVWDRCNFRQAVGAGALLRRQQLNVTKEPAM